LKDEIIRQSGGGLFFCDNAVRENGVSRRSGECTETCQYYAFFFDIATSSTHPELWNILTTKFGPDRKRHNEYPEIYFSNAFIGNYLRLDLLSRHGLKEQLLDEIERYFGYMAETTGTLWENDSDSASCNHGFASHVVCWLDSYLGD